MAKQQSKTGAGRPPVVVLEQYGELDRWQRWVFRKQEINPRIIRLGVEGAQVEWLGEVYACPACPGYPEAGRHVLRQVRRAVARPPFIPKGRKTPLQRDMEHMRALGMDSEAEDVARVLRERGGMAARHMLRRLSRGIEFPPVEEVRGSGPETDPEPDIRPEEVQPVRAVLRRWYEERDRTGPIVDIGRAYQFRVIYRDKAEPRPAGYAATVWKALREVRKGGVA